MKSVSTILLVEDEPLISQMYATALAAKKYQVVTAFNKHSALEALRSLTPALVLLDLMIPLGAGENLITYDHPVGFDVLEVMKRNSDWAGVKVMVVSNLESDEHRRHAESLGADRFVVKSNLEPRELVEQVGRLLAV